MVGKGHHDLVGEGDDLALTLLVLWGPWVRYCVMMKATCCVTVHLKVKIRRKVTEPWRKLECMFLMWMIGVARVCLWLTSVLSNTRDYGKGWMHPLTVFSVLDNICCCKECLRLWIALSLMKSVLSYGEGLRNMWRWEGEEDERRKGYFIGRGIVQQRSCNFIRKKRISENDEFSLRESLRGSVPPASASHCVPLSCRFYNVSGWRSGFCRDASMKWLVAHDFMTWDDMR
jgi:hypothetical protein